MIVWSEKCFFSFIYILDKSKELRPFLYFLKIFRLEPWAKGHAFIPPPSLSSVQFSFLFPFRFWGLFAFQAFPWIFSFFCVQSFVLLFHLSGIFSFFLSFIFSSLVFLFIFSTYLSVFFSFFFSVCYIFRCIFGLRWFLSCRLFWVAFAYFLFWLFFLSSLEGNKIEI